MTIFYGSVINGRGLSHKLIEGSRGEKVPGTRSPMPGRPGGEWRVGFDPSGARQQRNSWVSILGLPFTKTGFWPPLPGISACFL